MIKIFPSKPKQAMLCTGEVVDQGMIGATLDLLCTYNEFYPDDVPELFRRAQRPLDTLIQQEEFVAFVYRRNKARMSEVEAGAIAMEAKLLGMLVRASFGQEGGKWNIKSPIEGMSLEDVRQMK